MRQKIKEYSNGEVTVVWKADVCMHSANCVNGLKEVFNPGNKPWINVEGASSERIVDQVKQCPSGALSFYWNDREKAENQESTPASKKGKIAFKEPAKVDLIAGKTYAWCACGLSGNQPFCDGTHKSTDLRPNVFKAEEAKTVYLCQCKQTGNSPYCDGTHNSL